MLVLRCVILSGVRFRLIFHTTVHTVRRTLFVLYCRIVYIYVVLNKFVPFQVHFVLPGLPFGSLGAAWDQRSSSEELP